MINTWSELVAAFRAWWNAPIALERKQPEAMTPEEVKKLPSNVLNILNNSYVREMYYNELRAKVKRGERLTVEEKYRLRVHDEINNINRGLDNPDRLWEDK